MLRGPLQPPGAPQTLPVDVTIELLLRHQRRNSRATVSAGVDNSALPCVYTSSTRQKYAIRRKKHSYCLIQRQRRSAWLSGRGAFNFSTWLALILGGLALDALLGIPQVQSTYDYCRGKASQADTDGGVAEGDGLLNPEEFATMVYNVTNGTLDFFTAPGAVPDAVTASYSALLKQGEGGLALSDEALVLEFCSDLYGALLYFYGVPYSANSCLKAVQFGQGNNPRYVTERRKRR
jgi:hypothetical protein